MNPKPRVAKNRITTGRSAPVVVRPRWLRWPGRKVNMLLLYSRDTRMTADLYRRFGEFGLVMPWKPAWGPRPRRRFSQHREMVQNWNTLVGAIRRYSRIGHLVLDFHGGPGGLDAGGGLSSYFDDPSVAKLFTTRCQARVDGKRCGKLAPSGLRFCNDHRPPQPELWYGVKVEQISLRSCNVARDPQRMFAFGNYLNADWVSGYTWFMANATVDMTLARGSSQEEIERQLRPFQRYLMPSHNLDAAQLARRCQSRNVPIKIPLEWFNPEGVKDFPPDIPLDSNGQYRPNHRATGNPHRFKCEKDAKRVHLRTRRDLQKYTVDPGQLYPEFMEITIDMRSCRRFAKRPPGVWW